MTVAAQPFVMQIMLPCVEPAATLLQCIFTYPLIVDKPHCMHCTARPFICWLITQTQGCLCDLVFTTECLLHHHTSGCIPSQCSEVCHQQGMQKPNLQQHDETHLCSRVASCSTIRHRSAAYTSTPLSACHAHVP